MDSTASTFFKDAEYTELKQADSDSWQIGVAVVAMLPTIT
jgi:hypothetical protein